MYKVLLSIVSVFLLMVGVLFCAPPVSADDSEIYDDIIEHFNLDSSSYSYRGYIESSWVTFNGNIKSGLLYFVSDSPLKFTGVSISQTGSSFKIYDLYTYENYTRINDISHQDGDETFIYNHIGNSGVSFSSPFNWNGNTSPLTSIDANYVDIIEAGVPLDLRPYIVYNQISSPPYVNANVPKYSTLYTQYLNDKGFSVDSAFLANNDFELVQGLPVVGSYSELIANMGDYSGFYVIVTQNTYTYKFELARTPDYAPSTSFLDTYLILGLTFPTSTDISLYFGHDGTFIHSMCYRPDNANLYSVYSSDLSSMQIGDRTVIGHSVHVVGSDVPTGGYIGLKWRIQSPMIEISSLYLGIDYKKVVNNVVEEGSGSDDLDDFTNNYLSSVTFNSYQSVSVPAPPYDGSYDITYDSNFLYLIDKIFNVEIFTNMVVGVLAVSMACYIIFGKML